MDLRQFTTTPNNLESSSNNQDQRRTSVSSLSSYASSAYGGQTPNSSRLTQSRYFNSGTQPGQLPMGHPQAQQNQQQQGVGIGAGAGGWSNQQGMLNVTPWIEQQQQVSNNANSSNASIENQNFVNNYGNNLNQQNLTLHNLPPNLTNGNNPPGVNASVGGTGGSILSGIPPSLYHQNNSTITTYDPQSSRASPSTSHILPQSQQQQQQQDSKNDDSNVKNNDDNETNDNVNNTSNDNNNNNNKNNAATNNNENDGNRNVNEKDDDELIPTAIVIKNIPFAIKKEQLLEVMTKLNLPLPYAFNYHFDNGVFRGLAFANFTSTDETTSVVNLLNGREIGGRKLRVEYKKMLPLAERERIEREKREKRGQLEEQHRSASNVSLASMISVASAPAGLNKSLNAQQQQQSQQQQQVAAAASAIAAAASAAGTPTSSIHPNNVGGVPGGATGNPIGQSSILPSPLQPQHTGSERFYAPIPFINNLPIPPQQVDFNDPETLEYYSQLLFFRDDKDKLYNEIAYPSSLSNNHKRIISILCAFLGLMEHYDQNLILIKRRTLIHDPSPLLRSQSQSSIPLLSQQTTGGNGPMGLSSPNILGTVPTGGAMINGPGSAGNSQRFRQQTTIPQPTSSATSNRIPPNFNLGGLNNPSSSALSSAALLRNNPTPTRVLPNLYNQAAPGQPPQSTQGQSQQGQGPPSSSASTATQQQQQPHSGQNYFSQPAQPTQSQSQPTTPGLDSMSRFAPFQQGLSTLNSLQQFQAQQQQQQQQFAQQQHHQSQTNLQNISNSSNNVNGGNMGQFGSNDDSFGGRMSSSSNSSNGGNDTAGDATESLQGLTLSLGSETQSSNSPSIWGPRTVQQ